MDDVFQSWKSSHPVALGGSLNKPTSLFPLSSPEEVDKMSTKLLVPGDIASAVQPLHPEYDSAKQPQAAYKYADCGAPLTTIYTTRWQLLFM